MSLRTSLHVDSGFGQADTYEHSSHTVPAKAAIVWSDSAALSLRPMDGVGEAVGSGGVYLTSIDQASAEPLLDILEAVCLY